LLYRAGMASIDKRGEHAYRIRWRLDGRAIGPTQSVTAADIKRAEAVKAYVEALGSRVTDDEVYRSPLFPQPDRPAGMPTVAEYLIRWAKQREENNDVQPDTLDRYVQNANRWVVPFFGDYHLDSVTREVITKWLTWLGKQTSARGRPLSGNSIRHHHTLLHQVMAAAVVDKLIPVNPAARPAGSKKGTPGLPPVEPFDAVFLEPAEADRLIATADGQLRDMIVVALWTGLRLGELLVLRVMDVDLKAEEPAIFVRRALKRDHRIGGPKSRRSRRAVAVGTKVTAVLTRLTSGKGRSDLLFPNPQGEVWDEDTLSKRHFVPAVAAAQRCAAHLPPRPERKKHARAPRQWRHDEVSTCDCPTRLTATPRFHDLRHTHASWLMAVGEDMFVISRRLGHEKIGTTFDIYGHLGRNGDRRKLDALDDLASNRGG
jgi:integrase